MAGSGTIYVAGSVKEDGMKKFTFGAAFVAGMAAFALLCCILGFGDKDRQPVVATAANKPPVMETPGLPARMDFAGEPVPLDRWEVRDQLDRELTHNYYMTGNILYMLKLSKKYFSQIEATLAENGIPADFKYLCVAESNLQNLVSKAGASGFWQFMKGTAPGYNLEVGATVDERYHVAKSTQAACVYLKDAYRKFGNWTAAAASYNCGMGGYASRSSYQGSNNYYDLLLPEETQRYVFRILAFKHLLGNADSLGFKLNSTAHQPVKTRTILVTQSIPNLVLFARNQGTNYKILKWLNPWLRERSLSVRAGKSYELLVPE